MEDKYLKYAVDIMEGYRGRDKVMRTIGFGACMVGGIYMSRNNATRAQKFFKLSTEISACRTVLRLFDDLSMFASSMSYGLGKQEKNFYDKVLGVLKNITDQAFYPLEHIAWAADHGLISVNSSKSWWRASIMAWAFSLSLGIVRSIKKIIGINRIVEVKKKKGEETEDYVQKLLHQKKLETLSIFQNLADLGNAIHWLPVDNFLWSGKFSQTTVGFLGCASSLIGLYKILYKHMED